MRGGALGNDGDISHSAARAMLRVGGRRAEAVPIVAGALVAFLSRDD
jgi:hypothetical protein